MNITQTFLGKTLAISLLGMVMALGFAAIPAGAHQDPGGCNASAIQQTPSVSPFTPVYDGNLLTYSVTYSNLDPDGAGAISPCNITAANATITLPDTTVVNVLTAVNIPVGTTIICPGGAGCALGPYTYTVSHTDETSLNVTASFAVSGTLHTINGAHPVASDNDSLNTLVIHPNTITTIGSSIATVVSGGTVTLTITETNNGDVDLTDPHVVIDQGIGTLDENSASFTGVDGGDVGVLDPGETWTWILTSPAIAVDTTFTATGHGTDPLGNDVTWCDNGGGPGILCDQDERDQATVEVVLPLEVEKTAETSYDRDWDWTIEKSAATTTLTLAEGESYTVAYEVTVSPTSEDINHMVGGTITVTNPVGNPDATVNSIADVLNNSGATVVACDQVLPAVLSGGEVLNCTYSGSSDGSDTLNTATVETTGNVPGGSDDANVTWGDPDNVTDECVTVNDTNPGFPSPDVVICEGDTDKTIEYDITFGPEGGEGVDVPVACGEIDHLNTADFITNDNEETGHDDWTVHVNVNCFEGCTLTQGYWKTHSDRGPAPYDDNWNNLGNYDGDGFSDEEEDEDLLSSATDDPTWYEAFWTPPKKGNVWYQLAHQFMAAYLNSLNGASVPANVQVALDGAETWLETNDPNSIPKGKNNTQAAGWASLLGSYNEGTIGPGHCDEQNPPI